MAVPGAKEKVHKLIESKVQPLAKKGFKELKETVPKLLQTVNKIDHAISKGEEADTIKAYMRTLGVETRRLLDTRLTLRNASAALDEVTKDDKDYEADKDEIEKLKVELTEALADIEDVVKEVKASEDKATAQIDKLEKSESKAEKDWASIVLTYEDNVHIVEKNLKAFQAWDKDAQAAVKSRDAKGLKRLQAKMPSFKLSDEVLKGNMTMAYREKFQKQFDIKTFSAEFQAEFRGDLHKLNRFDKDAQIAAQECKKIMDNGPKLAVAPPDLKKAMSVLALPSQAESKLKAALELDEGPMIKSLDALAKDLKLKNTGKDMVKKLQSGGII